MKIAILHDAVVPNQSPDEQDNMVEALFVAKHLRTWHTVNLIPFVPNLGRVMTDLADTKPDVVFNLVESLCNCDSLSVVAVQLLESLHLPYTGNKIYAQTVTANKALTKQVLLQTGIPTPISTFKADTEFIAKSNTEHASAGLDESCIRCFNSSAEMQNFISLKMRQTGHEWMTEQYIDGREFNCAFLGEHILPPSELRFNSNFKGHKIRTYEAKWNEDSDSFTQIEKCFEMEDSIRKQLMHLTAECKQKLMLSGYARIDFRMDHNNNLYVIDVNTNPCISPDSSFLSMVEKDGIGIDDMFQTLIDIALKK